MFLISIIKLASDKNVEVTNTCIFGLKVKNNQRTKLLGNSCVAKQVFNTWLQIRSSQTLVNSRLERMLRMRARAEWLRANNKISDSQHCAQITLCDLFNCQLRRTLAINVKKKTFLPTYIRVESCL